MSPRPGWGLLWSALPRTLAALGVATSLLWCISWVDRGPGAALDPMQLAALCGPLACGATVAWLVASRVADGSWSAWQALGFGPGATLAPLFLLAGLGATAQLVLLSSPGGTVSGLELSSPVPAQAEIWPVPGGWGRPELNHWKKRPSSLNLRELVARSRSVDEAPVGSRPRVDRAELVRRIGWAGCWPVAIWLGWGLGQRQPRRRGTSPHRSLFAAVQTAAVLACCCVGLAVLSAYLASSTT
jgi:hypothetical protein